jgi:pimeloyl-ACP methyl ester carboxylesterase
MTDASQRVGSEYGAVIRRDWTSELLRREHPRDRSRIFTVHPPRSAASKPPVMLLHGVGNSGAIFGPVMPSLAELGPVLAPTMSPELLTAESDDRNSAVESLVGWLEEVHPPPWRVIGHSMGGVLTGLILRSRPDVVTSAVLLNSPLPGTVERLRRGDTLDRNGRALLAMKGLARITSFGRPRLPRWMQGPELAIVRTALRGFVRHPGVLDDEVISRAILWSRTTDGIDFLRLARELPVWEAEPHSERPVAIVVGDDDPLVPLSDHDALIDSYPDASFYLAEDCGHFAHIEQPRFTLDAISDFFDATA